MTTQNKKRGLGRRLDNILPSQETDIASAAIFDNYAAGAIAQIDIDKIETNPYQPRTDFDETALKELAESIKNQGVIQPVTVRQIAPQKYQLISGERRLRASKITGLKTIPVFIRMADDEQMLEMALIENIHRKNLNAIEVAISYQRLIEECQLTQDQLSEKVGKDRSTAANFLRLLKLPAEIQIAIRDGYITMGHAKALVNISDRKKQLVILKKIIDEDLSVRQVEMLAREKTAKKQKSIVPESYKIQAEILSKALNMGVKVNRDSKGKGSLTINFKNDEEFERLLDFINRGNL